MLSWLRRFSRSKNLPAAGANPAGANEHVELGRRMLALGEPARAVTCFRKAVELDAANLDAHIELGSVMLAFGNSDAAEQSARRALAIDARSLPALNNLGTALEANGKFAEAADSYRAALTMDPDCVPALANLCAVCLRLGAVDEAERSIERALQLNPTLVEALIRKGNVLLERRLPARAAQCYREALRLEPGSVAAHNSLGFTFDLEGRFDEAMACYEKALALDPESVQAHLNRSAIRFLKEDFAGGWDEYEWRLRDSRQSAIHERFGQPRWDGAPLAGRRILVYGEQGLGDQIMYASCLPEVIAQSAHCVIDCDARLAELFRRSFPQAFVHGGGATDATSWLAASGPVDLVTPAASVARFLRRSAADFPRHKGYLRADPDRIAAWRGRLQALGGGRKIGLSWRGGVAHTSRASRSIGLAELLPVLRQPGARFVSLQYGPCEAELAELRRHGVAIEHWQEAIDDYSETAALVMALDLTISVCTAVVHLAGALGQPVWVMAPVRPEARYGSQGESMRWYPSVRMFRQPRYGDWGTVVAAVEAALAGTS
jgi:tetratricopeptide (TPR) repeat protein